MYNESDQSISAANMEREIEIDENMSDLDYGFKSNLIFESSETEFDACDFEDEPLKKKFMMDENLSENSDILEFMNDANESDLDSHHTSQFNELLSSHIDNIEVHIFYFFFWFHKLIFSTTYYFRFSQKFSHR